MRMKFAHQRGVGLVELMVGITVGLIVSAGASMLAVNQINEHRRLMLETQIQQDLRTAADLLQQDLRRIGYRGPSEQGAWAPPAAVGSLNETAALVATTNNFNDVVSEQDGESRSITYTYARDIGGFSDEPRDAEHFGFKWDQGRQTLFLQLGKGNWQPITDPDSVLITSFNITVTTQSTSVGDFCEKACGTAGTPACPRHQVRNVSFTIVGQARHDANVKRTLSGTERLRADAISGMCPA